MRYVLAGPYWLYDEHRFTNSYFAGHFVSSSDIVDVIDETWCLSIDNAVVFDDPDLLCRVAAHLRASAMLRVVPVGDNNES